MLNQRCDCGVLGRAKFVWPNICYVSFCWLGLSGHRAQVRRLADKLQKLNAKNLQIHLIILIEYLKKK